MNTTQKRQVTRLGAVLALLSATALAMTLLVSPATATEPNQVWLHDAHKGSDSSTFQEEDDCGDFTSGVVWHFVLNQYSGDDTAHLVASFDGAGTLEADASKVLSKVQHFYINTPDDDILENAYAEVAGEAGDANLVLSHVCHAGGSSESPTPTPTQVEETATPTPTQVEETATPTPTQVEETATPTPTEVEETATPTPTEVEESATPTPTEVEESATPTPENEVQGGTGTPAPSLPDGAMSFGGTQNPVPTMLFALILLGSLGTLAWANVRTAKNRS